MSPSFFVLFAIVLASLARAQDHVVSYSTTDPGVTRSITNWGYDTGWNDPNNIQRSIIFMGTNVVNCVRVIAAESSILTNGSSLWNSSLSAADQLYLSNMVNEIRGYTPNVKWYLYADGGITNWYSSGSDSLYPDRFAALWNVNANFLNALTNWSAVSWVDMANEPDDSTTEGQPQDYYNTLGYLQTNVNFIGKTMGGCATLNSDGALSWFSPIASRSKLGSTHNLAGSAQNYVNFLQTVTADNAISFEPEVHNVGECIMGANYGLNGVIWWGPAELARGQFARGCQGARLGYSEDQTKWTAAAVYRAPSGNVQAFVGESERTSLTTTYQFFSKDRDVFYDGDGPRRDCNVTVIGSPTYGAGNNNEKVVNITWGSDIQPVVNGRYIVVNRNSGYVMEVPGGTTNNSTILDQLFYITNALYQEWDINPLTNTMVGDFSYSTIKAAHDGYLADNLGGSYANNGVVDQYNGPTNSFEQWYFEYAGAGYFKIHNRWSSKILGVANASKSLGAQIIQTSDTGSTSQQWRLIPLGASPTDTTAPAAPSGVTATANAVSVRLDWNTNSEPDLASYTVLRGDTNGGSYYIVARGLTNNFFTDKSANQNATYYYVVQAVDRSLNVSTNSLQVSAVPTLAQTLIAHYSFDQNFNDSSVNANNVIVTNGSPSFVAGVTGYALNFNGANQCVMLPSSIMTGVTNFTIGVWVYWGGGNAWQRIFDFGNGTNQYMNLTPASSSGTLRFCITTNSFPNNAEQAVQTSALPTNQWVHVAVTYDGTTASLYTNGVLAAAAAVSISPATFNPALNYLGKSQYYEIYGDPLLNGSLDDMRIYNYALSAAQVPQLLTSSVIWNGGASNNNWSSSMNWFNDVAPDPYGDNIIIAGALRTSPSMDNSYSVNSLTFSNNAGSFTIGAANGGTLALAGSLVNNSSNPQTLNVPVTLSAAQTLNAAAGNLILNSNLVNPSGFTVLGISNVTMNATISGAGGLTNASSGSLNLAGANNSIGGSLIVANGTLNITGGNIVLTNTTTCSIGYETGGGTMNLSNNATFTALQNVWVGGSDVTGSATGSLTINSGTANFGGSLTYGGPHFADGSLAIAASQNNVSSCSGTVTVSGGTAWVTNDLIVGYAGTGTGLLNISGSGTVNVGPASGKWLSLGKWDTCNGIINLSGGSLNLMNNSAIKFSSGNGGNNGGGGTNIINHNGGIVTFYSDAGTTVGGNGFIDLSQSGSTTANNTYNLNGGVLIVPQIISADTTGTRIFNFNGGTLKAAAASSNYFTSGSANTANVRNGGAIIDASSYAIAISQPLVHSTIAGDLTVDGGLTKNGAGALKLSGTNTYTGNTTINAGTLELAQSAPTLSTNSTVSIASGAVLQLDNATVTNTVSSFITNGVAARSGLYSSGNSSGRISGSGYLKVLTGITGPNGSNILTNSITGGGTILALSWGSNWTLQRQADNLNQGLGTNWQIFVAGNAGITGTNISIDETNGAVFYRLTYP